MFDDPNVVLHCEKLIKFIPEPKLWIRFPSIF